MSYELVVIGCSWGGLSALRKVLGPLPSTFPLPIVVAQHRSSQSTDGSMTAVLETYVSLAVSEADDKDSLEPGHIYIAPPDYHLLVERGSLALSTDEKVRFSRPSIDVLLESAADAYGTRLIAVILTGANEDGAIGIRRVSQMRGKSIVQDPGTAERAEMPQAAVDTGVVDMVLSLEDISEVLLSLAGAADSRGGLHVV
ncbi:MAG: two-component system, chemotaxis family, protein-glutamate methylesterase/glutaminase [Actinomycetota bacterium]|nr:two-component system, chemotaxis family, protein-glutamate methylesterase/glutaminase [Actinomycetota bacterium]